MICKKFILRLPSIHVARQLAPVGLASTTNWIQIASCPTHTQQLHITSITNDMIHNSTFSAAAYLYLGTSVDVAIWAEYSGILESSQLRARGDSVLMPSTTVL
jgi:hypothetical protein